MPEEARYHAALSSALSNNPHWIRESIESIEAAIKLDPTRPAYQASLALLLHGQGLTLRARKAAEAALRLAPDDPDVARVAAEVGAGPGPREPPPAAGLRGLLRRKP
jgi:tetratricopeptide (TPR) repeat protein